MQLQVLHPNTDEHLYRQAWQWRFSYPRHIKQWDGLKHFKPWFKRLRCRVSIGVFNPHLIALVTLRAAGNDIYEVDVDCERRIDRIDLISALLSIQRTVFNQWQAREVFCGVISRNQGIITIAEQCGFQRDGTEEQVGKLRWVRMRITDVEYKNQHQYRIDPESIYQSARSEQPRYRSA